MDDREYQALVELVERQLRISGVPGIADRRHYLEFDAESGEPRLLEPRQRLVLLLEAFERHVITQDGQLLEHCLAEKNDVVGGDGPRRIVVEVAGDGSAREVDLAEAPDMAPIRERLRGLISNLRDPPSFGLKL